MTTPALRLTAFLFLAACSHNALHRLPDPTPDIAQANPKLVGIVIKRIEAANQHDWAAWTQLHTPDCRRTAPELEQPLESVAEMRAGIERLTQAFPDYRNALIRAVGQGPWLAVELRSSGTFTHALEVSKFPFWIPPTGNGFRQYWTALIRFDGELIAEIREYYDQTDLVNQLQGGEPKNW